MLLANAHFCFPSIALKSRSAGHHPTRWTLWVGSLVPPPPCEILWGAAAAYGHHGGCRISRRESTSAWGMRSGQLPGSSAKSCPCSDNLEYNLALDAITVQLCCSSTQPVPLYTVRPEVPIASTYIHERTKMRIITRAYKCAIPYTAIYNFKEFSWLTTCHCALIIGQTAQCIQFTHKYMQIIRSNTN